MTLMMRVHSPWSAAYPQRYIPELLHLSIFNSNLYLQLRFQSLLMISLRDLTLLLQWQGGEGSHVLWLWDPRPERCNSGRG